MVGLPAEEVAPFSTKQLVVVVAGPGVQFVEHHLHPLGVGHGTDAVALRGAHHAATRQKLIFVDHRSSANGVADEFEVGGLQRFGNAAGKKGGLGCQLAPTADALGDLLLGIVDEPHV